MFLMYPHLRNLEITQRKSTVEIIVLLILDKEICNPLHLINIQETKITL